MPGQPLPDLSPEMLLSYGGLRELEGAVAMRGEPPVHASRQVAEAAQAVIESWEPAIDEGFSISFDTESLGDLDDAHFQRPARAERFNVLRPPQHEPFRPPPPEPGPQGGPMREVGRVGRFAILAEGSSRSETILAEARARLDDRLSSRQLPESAPRVTAQEMNAKQRAHRDAVHDTMPTAYDRLLGDDQYEDDLE